MATVRVLCSRFDVLPEYKHTSGGIILEEEQISITELIYVLLSKWPMLVISFIVAAAIAFSVTLIFITPKYQSRGKLYVSSESQRTIQQSDAVAYNTVLTNQKLVNTYMEILRSDSFLLTVSEDIGGKYTHSQIADMLSMTAVNQTELLEISVLCPDPYDAYKITGSIIKNAGDEIERVVDGGSVRIIDNASMPSAPSTPNVYKNTAIGALIGLVIGAIAIFLMEILDTRVKPNDDLQTKYSIPVLGEIPWLLADK